MARKNGGPWWGSQQPEWDEAAHRPFLASSVSSLTGPEGPQGCHVVFPPLQVPENLTASVPQLWTLPSPSASQLRSSTPLVHATWSPSPIAFIPAPTALSQGRKRQSNPPVLGACLPHALGANPGQPAANGRYRVNQAILGASAALARVEVRASCPDRASAE